MPKDRGKRLKQALEMRKRNKLHAFAVEVGVNPSSVTRWLKGGLISTEHAVKICQTLSISLDWLLLGKEQAGTHPLAPLSRHEERIIEACRIMPADFIEKVEAMLVTAARISKG